MARIFFISALILWAMRLGGQSAPAGAQAGYVDSQVCARCHREIAEKYARTGMGRSFYKPAPANTVEDYSRQPEYFHALSDSHYSMTARNGRYFQKRWQIGPDGKEINGEELSIDYVIGSGNHGRFYLHRTEQDMLIELPLGWYPRGGGGKGGEWGMVPQSDSPQPKTRQFIAYKCMFCHNAYPAIPAGSDVPGSNPVFTGALPEGIDCQRCHGPGAEHVRTQGRTGMVNPAKLSPERRMEVCLQCHLEPTSGDIPAKLQRFNRGPFSYLPGQPLVDFTIFFDYAPGSGREDRFEGVGGAYRFRQSRCVRESGGKLECGSCHDPHDVPRGADAIRHYSSVCLQCHASAATAHPAGISATPSDCITCHMPKRRAEDGHHMIFTDHRIQRHAPANALADFPEKPGEEYHGAVEPYYPSPLPNTPENNLYRAVAQVGMRNNVAAGMPDLVRLLDAVRPREPEFYMVLGEGWKALGNPAEAATAYRHALELQPDSARAMRALASVDPDHAEEILAKAVQAAPNDAESWFRYGVQTKSAERIQRAIDLNPWFPNQSRRLAELTRSVSALGDALRTDPFDDAAWDLGGQIMAEKGNFPAAFFDFEKALRIHPSGQYLFDYALALARANRFEDAEARALMALQSDAGIAEAHELLGGLHSRKNELPDAAREYEAALALEPELARVRLRLGLVRAAQGDRTRAREQLSEAAKSRDPEIARQANQALRQLGAR